MSYEEEPWFPEPFGPVYERPPGAPCPGCGCCTLRLCQLAAGKDAPCSQLSGDPQAVAGCPCTATAGARTRARAMTGDGEPDPAEITWRTDDWTGRPRDPEDPGPEPRDEGRTSGYRRWLP